MSGVTPKDRQIDEINAPPSLRGKIDCEIQRIKVAPQAENVLDVSQQADNVG